MRTRRRIHPYVRPELAERLVAYCAAKGITESAAVETAIEAHLAGAERDNAVIMRKLDRLGGAAARHQRDTDVLTEALAVFVETWLCVMPERTPEEKAAAARVGRARYQQFIDIVSARVARGGRFVGDVVADRASAVSAVPRAPGATTRPG